MIGPDPRKVRRAFARAAESYRKHAELQREVAQRLDEHLRFTRLAPCRILDIGSGDGLFAERLQARFPKAEMYLLDIAEPMLRLAQMRLRPRWPWRRRRLFCLCGDAARLPLAETSFDLVASNLTMQWVADPAAMLAEMRRVCRKGGLILFSTFGMRTLQELREALVALDPNLRRRVLAFPDIMALGDLLHGFAVETTVLDVDVFRRTYPSARALMRELKAIGASASALPPARKGLGGRRWLRELERIYQERFPAEEGGVVATFEVIYAQAWAR